MFLLGAILTGSIISTAVSTHSINKKIPKPEKPKFSTNTQAVINYLLMGDATARTVAEAIGLEKRQVDSIFTSYLQRKGYGIRIPIEKSEPLLHITNEFIENYK